MFSGGVKKDHWHVLCNVKFSSKSNDNISFCKVGSQRDLHKILGIFTRKLEDYF